MTGLSFIAVVLLLHIQNINAQCTTPEMRTAILDEALAALECESYTCGKFFVCILNDPLHAQAHSNVFNVTH